MCPKLSVRADYLDPFHTQIHDENICHTHNEFIAISQTHLDTHLELLNAVTATRPDNAGCSNRAVAEDVAIPY